MAETIQESDEILAKWLAKTLSRGDTSLFIGIKTNPKAKLNKFEIYWFHSKDDFDLELTPYEQFSEAHSRFCGSLKEAYAYGFQQIKEYKESNPSIRVDIVDLTD